MQKDSKSQMSLERPYLLEGRVYTNPAGEIHARAEVPYSRPSCSVISLSSPELWVLSPKSKSLHTHVLNKKDKGWGVSMKERKKKESKDGGTLRN